MKIYLNILKHSLKWFLGGIKFEINAYKRYREYKKIIYSLKKIYPNSKLTSLFDEMLEENEELLENENELAFIMKGGVGTSKNCVEAIEILDRMNIIIRKMEWHRCTCVETIEEKN